MQILNLSCRLVIMIAVGYGIRKLNIVKDSFDKPLADLMIKVLLPCMIVNSFCKEFSKQLLIDGMVVIALTFVLILLILILTTLYYNRTGKKIFGKLLRYCLTFNNFTYIGLPVMESVFGDNGLFYYTMFSMPTRILLYSLNEPLLSNSNEKCERKSFFEGLKPLLTPPIIAIFIGLGLYITGFRFVAPIQDALASLGSTCTPLGMISCGMIIGNYDLKKLMKLKYFKIPLLRHFAVPVLALILTLLLPVSKDIKIVMILYAALPVPSATTTFALEYSEHEKELHYLGSGTVLISTLMSALAIPFWIYITSMIF